jgi:hypothetical protein
MLRANATFERRLRRLERTVVTPLQVLQEIGNQALRAISDEDLDHLQAFFVRGGPYYESVPAERAALERYHAQLEAAALRITKRSLAGLGVHAPFGRN